MSHMQNLGIDWRDCRRQSPNGRFLPPGAYLMAALKKCHLTVLVTTIMTMGRIPWDLGMGLSSQSLNRQR